MKLHKRYLPAVAALGSIALLLPTAASSEPLTVAAVNEGLYYHHWTNAQQTILTNEKVTFSNPYTEAPYHGLEFTSGSPVSCTGIPAAAKEKIGAPNWHGECTFTKPGTYTFIYTVHPTEMKGTIVVKNPGEPLAVTESANPIGETSATLTGKVNPEGLETSYHFRYGRTTSYEDGSSPSVKLSASKANESVSAEIAGLAAGTIYHFQLVAENSAGTIDGADQTFTTTVAPGPPSATTGAATSVGQTEATLKGTVNPDGRQTSYFFEWGTSTSYGNLTTETSAGESHTARSVTMPLSVLSPAATYHYRIVAKNTSSETVDGEDQTFTTSSPPSAPPPPSTPPPPPSTPTPPSSSTPSPPLAGSLPTNPISKTASGPPLASGSLKLTAPRRGSSVHGSVEVTQAGAGGRLEVDLLAKGTLLGKSHGSGSKLVNVARFLHQSVSAGKLSFTLSLTALGKHALAHRHSLALTAQATLTPTSGSPGSLSRSITLHA